MSGPEVRPGDIVDLIPIPVLLVDEEGRIEQCNRSARELLGAGGGAGAARVTDRTVEPPETVRRYLRMCARNLSPVPGRFTLRADDEQPRVFRFSGARIGRARDGPRLICLALEALESSPQRRFLALNETIERLRLEVRARRRTEALVEAQKETLACVLGGRPLEEALTILCKAVEAHSDGMIVSVLLLDEHGRLRHCASPSLPAEYVVAIDGLMIGPEVGSCGTAAYTGQQVIVADIATDRRWVAFREAAESAGLAACWSAPIRASTDKILGTVALYYARPRTPRAEQLELIDMTLYIAALAIERHQALERESRLLAETEKARERAEAENRSKDMFLSILSHELRNPLSAIANAANALASREGADADDENLQRIVLNATQHLTRLVDDLLDVTRLREGKLELQLETFAIEELLEELRAALSASYPDRRIDFRFEGVSGPMRADRARVRQILQNLVDNAIKYSAPDTGVRFSVGLSDTDVHASVRDAGEGISAELLPRIFEPFVQAENSLARSRGGLGLGLALTKRLCDMHGGTIEIKSEGPGRGSEATIRLPRGTTERHATRRVERRTAVRSGVGKRVLLVEDNVDARTALSALMRRWGHSVCCAGDGGEALELIRAHAFDVAFVDIGLPVLDGYEVAKAVRDDRRFDRVQLVALTGYGQDDDCERVRKAGFDAHLVKPATPNGLIELLAD